MVCMSSLWAWTGSHVVCSQSVSNLLSSLPWVSSFLYHKSACCKPLLLITSSRHCSTVHHHRHHLCVGWCNLWIVIQATGNQEPCTCSSLPTNGTRSPSSSLPPSHEGLPQISLTPTINIVGTAFGWSHRFRLSISCICLILLLAPIAVIAATHRSPSNPENYSII